MSDWEELPETDLAADLDACAPGYESRSAKFRARAKAWLQNRAPRASYRSHLHRAAPADKAPTPPRRFTWED